MLALFVEHIYIALGFCWRTLFISNGSDTAYLPHVEVDVVNDGVVGADGELAHPVLDDLLLGVLLPVRVGQPELRRGSRPWDVLDRA